MWRLRADLRLQFERLRYACCKQLRASLRGVTDIRSIDAQLSEGPLRLTTDRKGPGSFQQAPHLLCNPRSSSDLAGCGSPYGGGLTYMVRMVWYRIPNEESGKQRLHLTPEYVRTVFRVRCVHLGGHLATYRKHRIHELCLRHDRNPRKNDIPTAQALLQGESIRACSCSTLSSSGDSACVQSRHLDSPILDAHHGTG